MLGTVTPDEFKFAPEADIKALRTMISMLSVIQRVDRPIKSPELDPPLTGTDLQAKELRVLSALATVLVMENEVVAVVAKHGNHGIGFGGVVEVIACTDSFVDKESESQPPKSLLNTFLSTYNPWFSDTSKLELAIHNQADDFQKLTISELLDKFKEGTKKEKRKLYGQ